MSAEREIKIFLVPRHLPSLTAIADIFERSPNTVREWYRQGAPIAFDGTRYSAEYNALQAWCVENSVR